MGIHASRMQSSITENNLSSDLTTFVIQAVSHAYHKHKTLHNNPHFGDLPDVSYIFDSQAIMADIKAVLCNNYPGVNWDCLAGPEVSYDPSPRLQYFIRFDIDRTSFSDILGGHHDFCRVIVWGRSV